MPIMPVVGSIVEGEAPDAIMSDVTSCAESSNRGHHQHLIHDLTPELLGRAATFFDIAAHDIMNLCIVVGRQRSHDIRRSYLRRNFNYLRYFLLQLLSRIDKQKRIQNGFGFVRGSLTPGDDYRPVCRDRIISWMAVNTDWRSRCTPDKLQLYQNPYVALETDTDQLMSILFVLSRDRYTKVPEDDDFPMVINPWRVRNTSREVAYRRDDLPEYEKVRENFHLSTIKPGDCLIEAQEVLEEERNDQTRENSRHFIAGDDFREIFKLFQEIDRETHEEVYDEVEDDYHYEHNPLDYRLTFMRHPDLIFNNAAVAAELGLVDVLQHLVEVRSIDANSRQWRSLTSPAHCMPLAVVSLFATPDISALLYLLTVQNIDLKFRLDTVWSKIVYPAATNRPGVLLRLPPRYHDEWPFLNAVLIKTRSGISCQALGSLVRRPDVDVNALDALNRSPLFVFALFLRPGVTNFEVASTLLEAGADPHVGNCWEKVQAMRIRRASERSERMAAFDDLLALFDKLIVQT